MGFKFLYIDDEPFKAEGIIKPLIDSDLSIEVEPPKTWDEQKADLIESKRLDEFDGVLLDLKLQFSDGENKIKYIGADLAQSIRNDVKTGKVRDLPIFLCSTDPLMLGMLDRTSYDVFDLKYTKADFSSKPNIKSELISFVYAYIKLLKDRRIKTVLEKETTENDELVALQIELNKCSTPHEIVYLIQHAVINCNGLLLDEDLLAIRLGVDHQKSKDWLKFKEKVLSEFKYRGILNECRERWWKADILEWWRENFGKSLKIMSADERVEIIKQKFELSDIIPLALPKHHQFNTFWYRCRISGSPLESSDGLRTIEMPRFVWQEPSYISISYIISEDRDLEAIMSLLGFNEQKLVEDLTRSVK